MWTASDFSNIFRGVFQNKLGKRSLSILAILLVFGSLMGAAALAAPAPQSTANPPASAQERGELRRLLESRYEVLPVSGGIVLKPKKVRAGIRTIEVTGAKVAVNGEGVSTRTLRDWLGEDADSILRLQGLSAAEQRQVFGLDDAGEAVAAEEPTPEPEASPAPADIEEEETPAGDTTSDVDVAEEPAAPAEEPATPSGRHSAGSRVNVLGSVHVEADEIVQDAIAVGGSATVDGEVTQDVVAVGGNVRIKGRVGGEATSVGGNVYLGPKAVVEGNVTSVGGRIYREPGARIGGDTSDVAMPPWNQGWRGDHDWTPWGPWGFWGGVSDVMGNLTWLILVGLLTCLTLLVARVPLERVDRQLSAQPWPSALVGLAGTIFFWPLFIVVTVLLAITVVGCALFLLYPFLFLYLALLGILGYSTVAYRLGRWIETRTNRSFGSPYAVALVGVVAIQIWSVLASMLDMIPWMGVFAFLTGLFGFLTQAAAWIVGFGAVILSRFGTAPGYWPRQGPPSSSVPPPPPYSSDPYTPSDEPVDSLPLAEESRWEEPEPYPESYPPPPPEGEPR
jgi:hypothetical protein